MNESTPTPNGNSIARLLVVMTLCAAISVVALAATGHADIATVAIVVGLFTLPTATLISVLNGRETVALSRESAARSREAATAAILSKQASDIAAATALETHGLVNGQMSAFREFMEQRLASEVAAALARGKLEGHVAEQESPGVAQPPPVAVSP